MQANPHKRLRHLYGARMMAQYKGVPLGELSPHVYAIAEQASIGFCVTLIVICPEGVRNPKQKRK